MSSDVILLPNNLYGAYIPLAVRLASAPVGAAVKIYVAPQAETTMTVDQVDEETLQTPERTFTTLRVRVSVANPAGAMAMFVWMEADGRLVRISIPAAQLEVAREDITSSVARQVTYSRDGDQDIRIPANGFSLAGTLSRPTAKTSGKLPAVVLLAGSGPMTRDEVVAGIPTFGQLASRLADAGYLVVRYDKRGIGQSGGRAEAVTLQDYAEDARAAVAFLADRKDVDERRIFLVGHSEGGFVAMLAADKRVAGIALCGVPSVSGHDLVLEQQQTALEGLQLSYAEREEKIALQRRLQQAVITGQGWEAVTIDVRKQADTPWFRSFLLFDPAARMPKVNVPILIVQGERDRQVLARHGDGLLTLANARKKNPGASLVQIAGVNHLFVPAPTGAVSEYAALSVREISPDWANALVDWMARHRR